jgi:hypothetical protein
MAAILSIVLPSLGSSGVPVQPGPKIDVSYFGMHIHRAENAWPNVAFGSWRLWDAGADWASLEPIRGQWDFNRLDKYIALSLKHGIEPVLVLGNSPVWASSRPFERSAYRYGGAAEPRSLSDWENYVRIVATRYRGKVRYYEIWNEPNLTQFYSGSVKTMLELTRVAHASLKDVDPRIQVLSPSPTEQRGIKWLDEFLRLGGGDYVDIIAYHFYVRPAPPEKMVTLIGDVRLLMDRYGQGAKPLWNTESGWDILNAGQDSTVSDALSSNLAADFVARALVLNWVSGVSRFYWYAWDNTIMGLVERDKKSLKLAARAYSRTAMWLIGVVMEGCTTDRYGSWVCKMNRQNERNAWIIWNPEKHLDMELPSKWNAIEYLTLDGVTHEIKGQDSGRVPISSSPILVKADPLQW